MKAGKSDKSATGKTRDERKSSQGFVDIKTRTIEQLDELIERQNKLLQNRPFVEKLPDKGQKISLFKTELETERKRRQEEYESACHLLHKLSLNDADPNEIEWSQQKAKAHEEQSNGNQENSEDDIDVLKIVASHSGTASGKIYSSENKINGDDVSNIKKTLYIDKFCEKYGKTEKQKERFKPNQLKSNDKTVFISSAEKVKQKLGEKWEVTEATPPIPVYKDTVMISLSESLKLQKEQADALKEIAKKHAMEKLLQNMSLKMGDKLPVKDVTNYRSANPDFDDITDEENDSDDREDDEDREKTVCYHVENDEL